MDIDYLTEQEPDVVLDTERGLRDRFGVPGATVYHPKGDRFTVLIDEAVADGNPGFYRFTVAEELGHVRLHRAILRSVRTMEDAVALQTSDDYQLMDRNAKWITSALLMPRDPLLRDAKKIYADLVKQHGFGRPELIRRALVIRLGQRYVVNVSPHGISPPQLALGGPQAGGSRPGSQDEFTAVSEKPMVERRDVALSICGRAVYLGLVGLRDTQENRGVEAVAEGLTYAWVSMRDENG